MCRDVRATMGDTLGRVIFFVMYVLLSTRVWKPSSQSGGGSWVPSRGMTDSSFVSATHCQRQFCFSLFTFHSTVAFATEGLGVGTCGDDGDLPRVIAKLYCVRGIPICTLSIRH